MILAIILDNIRQNLLQRSYLQETLIDFVDTYVSFSPLDLDLVMMIAVTFVIALCVTLITEFVLPKYVKSGWEYSGGGVSDSQKPTPEQGSGVIKKNTDIPKFMEKGLKGSLSFLIGLGILLLIWMLLGLPIGPGAVIMM